LERTIEMTIASFSRPWKPSTVPTSSKPPPAAAAASLSGSSSSRSFCTW